MPQLAGEDILASDIWTPKYIVKASAQSVTSSTTLVDDADFQVTLPPGVYQLMAISHVVGVSSATLGGFKAAWSNTGTMTSLGRSILGPAFGTTDTATSIKARMSTHNFNTAVEFGVNTVSSRCQDEFLVQVTATGVVKYQWAQFASSPTPTTSSTASKLLITQVEAWS